MGGECVQAAHPLSGKLSCSFHLLNLRRTIPSYSGHNPQSCSTDLWVRGREGLLTTAALVHRMCRCAGSSNDITRQFIGQ